MDKDLEVISIFGGRGSGKTTKAKALIKQRKRVVIYDLKDEYPYTKIHGLSEFGKFMRQNWYKNFVVSYVPKAREKSEHIAELSQLCFKLCEAQKQDEKKNAGNNLTIVAEEMSLSAPNQRYPVGQGGFEYAINIAREWGIEVIGISQRPAQANPDFRSNASNNFFFRLADKLDRDAVREKIGPQEAEKLISLKPHDYIQFHNGQISRGKNKL